jgi:NifB/MoaA-like Fe-S oxidoreductase
MKQLEKKRARGEFSEKDAKAIYGTIATGELFFPMLKQACDEMNAKFGTRLKAVAVENTFFGNGVTVAGLLTGRDFVNAASGFAGKFVMIPQDCWREHDQKFLDDMTIGELEVNIGWRIVKSWNEILDLPEPKQAKEFRTLSHDYGQVTSISA